MKQAESRAVFAIFGHDAHNAREAAIDGTQQRCASLSFYLKGLFEEVALGYS
jgi:hypothetical protein